MAKKLLYNKEQCHLSREAAYKSGKKNIIIHVTGHTAKGSGKNSGGDLAALWCLGS